MKTEWIEDLLALSQQPNFSRAAEGRHLTQSTLSRRIQMLEAWLGAELIDRQARPICLTAAGQRHIAEFRNIVNALSDIQKKVREEANNIVRFRLATQHSLTVSRLPALVEMLARHTQRWRVELSIRSSGRNGCIVQFTRGEVDLMLCLEESDNRLDGTLPWAKRMMVGAEPLVPVSAAGENGQPRFVLQNGYPLPLITPPKNSFLGRLIFERLAPLLDLYKAEVVHESTFLTGIKEMVLAGLGVAWLPASLVMREVNMGKLAVIDCERRPLTLELALYHHPGQTNSEAIKLVWSSLVQINGSIAGTQ